MATGSTGLLTLRGALGATEGAATTPTRILYIGGPENIDLSGIQQFDTVEDRVAWAKRDGLRTVYNGIENNTVRFNNVPASFEDFGFILSTVVGIASGSTGLGANTPTTTDTSAYTRLFKPSQTATAYGSTGGYDLHLQVAYNDLLSTVGWSIPGLRCTDLSVTFRKRVSGTDHGITWSGTFQTPKTCTQITALTGSLSDRTQTIASGLNNKAYVESAYNASISTTDPEIMEATFHVQQDPSFHDGMDATALHTSMHFPGQWLSELTLTRKFSDTTELAAYKARTTRHVRLINEGAQVGAVSAKNTIQLDFVGKPMEHTHTEVDRMLYASIRYEGIYDSTLLSSWAINTINAVSTAYTSV